MFPPLISFIALSRLKSDLIATCRHVYTKRDAGRDRVRQVTTPCRFGEPKSPSSSCERRRAVHGRSVSLSSTSGDSDSEVSDADEVVYLRKQLARYQYKTRKLSKAVKLLRSTMESSLKVASSDSTARAVVKQNQSSTPLPTSGVELAVTPKFNQSRQINSGRSKVDPVRAAYVSGAILLGGCVLSLVGQVAVLKLCGSIGPASTRRPASSLNDTITSKRGLAIFACLSTAYSVLYGCLRYATLLTHRCTALCPF